MFAMAEMPKRLKKTLWVVFCCWSGLLFGCDIVDSVVFALQVYIRFALKYTEEERLLWETALVGKSLKTFAYKKHSYLAGRVPIEIIHSQANMQINWFISGLKNQCSGHMSFRTFVQFILHVKPVNVIPPKYFIRLSCTVHVQILC